MRKRKKSINDLAKLRIKKGIRQKDFSEIIGDAQGNVSRKESRKLMEFKVVDLIKFSRALNIEPNEVITLVEKGIYK